jgi:hypothetical protein
MQTHLASPAQTHRASTAVPAGFRARLAVVTAFLQRLPLPLLQLLFRLAIAAVFLKGGLTKTAHWMLTVQLFADEYQVPILSPEMAAMMSVGPGSLARLSLASRQTRALLAETMPLDLRQSHPAPAVSPDSRSGADVSTVVLTRSPAGDQEGREAH